MSVFTGAFVRRIAVAAIAAAALVAPITATTPSAEAAGSVKASVSLAAPTSGTYATNIKLTGTVWRYQTSTKIAGATVYLQRATHGKTNWGNLTSTTSSITGTFAFAVMQTSAYDYRAYYPGSTTYTAAWSPVRYPAVLQKVVFSTIKTTSWEAGTLQATGYVYPAPPSGTQIWLQRYDSANKVWKNYISGRTTGASAVTIKGNVPGNVGTYRLYAPLRYPYAAGSSGAATYAHYRWRGAFTKPLIATGGTANPQFAVIPDDPDKSAAMTSTNAGGSVWADINTYRCTRVDLAIGNFASEAVKVDLLRGTTTLVSRTVAPQSINGPGLTVFSALAGGASKVRLQLTDTGTNSGIEAFAGTHFLCAS